MEEKAQFLFSKDNYKYFYLEINEENLFSYGISKRIDIEKNEVIIQGQLRDSCQKIFIEYKLLLKKQNLSICFVPLL